VDVIGMNCATGPAEMGEHLRYLAQHARTPLSCLPNAGLPELRDGKPWYPLTPTELAEAHTRFVTEFGLSVVGGCCGPTPEHIHHVVASLAGAPARPPVAWPPAAGPAGPPRNRRTSPACPASTSRSRSTRTPPT